jgi:hypothetical protein
MAMIVGVETETELLSSMGKMKQGDGERLRLPWHMLRVYPDPDTLMACTAERRACLSMRLLVLLA